MAAAYLNAPDLVVIQRCHKVPYRSQREANNILKTHPTWKGFSLVDAGNGKLGVYRCGICLRWHLGHQKHHNDLSSKWMRKESNAVSS